MSQLPSTWPLREELSSPQAGYENRRGPGDLNYEPLWRATFGYSREHGFLTEPPVTTICEVSIHADIVLNAPLDTIAIESLNFRNCQTIKLSAKPGSKQVETRALLDSGAGGNFIGEDFLSTLGVT